MSLLCCTWTLRPQSSVLSKEAFPPWMYAMNHSLLQQNQYKLVAEVLAIANGSDNLPALLVIKSTRLRLWLWVLGVEGCMSKLHENTCILSYRLKYRSGDPPCAFCKSFHTPVSFLTPVVKLFVDCHYSSSSHVQSSYL